VDSTVTGGGGSGSDDDDETAAAILDDADEDGGPSGGCGNLTTKTNDDASGSISGSDDDDKDGGPSGSDDEDEDEDRLEHDDDDDEDDDEDDDDEDDDDDDDDDDEEDDDDDDDDDEDDDDEKKKKKKKKQKKEEEEKKKKEEEEEKKKKKEEEEEKKKKKEKKDGGSVENDANNHVPSNANWSKEFTEAVDAKKAEYTKKTELLCCGNVFRKIVFKTLVCLLDDPKYLLVLQQLARENLMRWEIQPPSVGEAQTAGWFSETYRDDDQRCKRVEYRVGGGASVYVCEGDWGDVAQKFTQRFGKTFAVLNMANAYVAGGGVVEGMIAQEENMYRRTDCWAKARDSFTTEDVKDG
jgi:hypothetical protein